MSLFSGDKSILLRARTHKHTGIQYVPKDEHLDTQWENNQKTSNVIAKKTDGEQ